MRLRTTINGIKFDQEIPDNAWLLDFLREELELTGVKQSCLVQVCGACTVLVDDEPVSSCCTLAADVDGREVTSIEGLVGSEFHSRVTEHAERLAAVQCGFCTPGLVMTLASIVRCGEIPRDEEGLRHALRGSVCRCTGYQSILDLSRAVLGSK